MSNHLASAISHIEKEIKKYEVMEKKAYDRLYASTNDINTWGDGTLATQHDKIQKYIHKLNKIVEELNKYQYTL